MLFDNEGLDLSFLNLSNIDNNNNLNLYSYKDGFLRGNMFKDEYVPYKDLTFINISPKSEKEAKLWNVMQYSFAINDLNLFLDIHPDNKSALNKLKELIELEKMAHDEYVNLYGPLNVCDTKGSTFTWINEPWPWDGLGGIKYV